MGYYGWKDQSTFDSTERNEKLRETWTNEEAIGAAGIGAGLGWSWGLEDHQGIWEEENLSCG